MNKILFCILTCNRFYYLRNCLNSIIDFVDMNRVDVVVCDNKTVEPQFASYMEEITKKHENIKLKRFKDRTRNELYRAMNWAVKRAKRKGYKIINFIQDDYQYLYRYDKHLDDVEYIFRKHKNIGQVNCNLGWKRKSKGIGKTKLFTVRGTHYSILLQKRVVDNGFTRVSMYDQTGPYPVDTVSWGGDVKKGFGKQPGRYAGLENGEVWFGRECEKRGYKRAISLCPNMGMMFDCAYVRGNVRMGQYFAPPGRFYLRELSKDDIKKIERNHGKKKFSFIEEFCKPDGWKSKTMDKHTPDKTVVKF